MTKKFYDIFNYGSLILVAILVILMVTQVIPVDFYEYILGFTILIFVARIVLRIYASKLNRKNNPGE